jgi:hypothetical protein
LNIMTKVFVVLSTVFSLTGLVFVVLILNQQQKYRDALSEADVARVAALATTEKLKGERENYRDALERLDNIKRTRDASFQQDIRNLQNKIAGLEREVATGRNDLITAHATITSLTTANQAMTDTITKLNGELAELRRQVPLLTQQNAELNRKNDEYNTALDAAKNTIRQLQEELAAKEEPTAAPATDTSEETPTLSALNPINGKVTRVDTQNGRTFITLSLGKRDGVQERFRFTLYRGNTYVGDAVVTKVTINESVAEVTVLKPGQVVAASDLAISGLKP